MSAYFCDSETFHAIATAAESAGLADYATAYRQLVTENLRSLNHRYPSETADHCRLAAAALAERPQHIHQGPAALCRTMGEFTYQSCEHPSFADSPADRLIQQLQAISRQPQPAAMAAAPVAIQHQEPEPEPEPEQSSTESARQQLSRMLAAPSAVPMPTPESKIAELARETRRAGLVLLQTLAIISDGQPSGEHFATLAARVTAVTSDSDTETATSEAHRLALALRLVLDAAT